MTPEEKAKSIVNSLISEGTDKVTAIRAAKLAVYEILSCVEWPYTLYYTEVQEAIESFEK